MKLRIAIVLLAIPSLMYAPSAHTNGTTAPDFDSKTKTFRNSKKFTVQYDKFRDESRVAVGPFDVADLLRGVRIYSLKMTARFIYSGRDVKQPSEDFALLFRSRSDEWKFLKNREMYMLVDGERISIGEAEYDGDVERRGTDVSEFLAFPIPPNVFKRLAYAKQAEFKIGRWAITLKDEHLEAFRNLYSLSQ